MAKTKQSLGIWLILLMVIITAIALAPKVGEGWGGDTYDPIDYAREQATLTKIEREAALAETWAPIWAFVWNAAGILAVFGVLAYLGALGVAHAQAQFQERRPDAAGRLPVLRSQLATTAEWALTAFHATRQAEAARQPVPHSVSTSYAPHSDYRYAGGGGSGAAVLPADTAAVTPALPPIIDLADVPHTPTVNSILLGLGPGGQPVTVPMKSLWHIALAGPTGNGKSNIARLVVAQLQSLGAKVCVGDPKWTEYDAEQDEDWRPIGARLHREPAHTPKDIAALLAWSSAEMERRLALRRAGERPGSPLFIYLDELPWIAAHVKDAEAHIGDLVRVGRGVGLFMLVGAQDMLAKSVNLSAERENFRTGFYLGGDRRTGSVLLGLPQREVPEPEGVGLAWLRSAATTPPQQVRVPYASNRAVYKLLTSDEPRYDFRAASRGAAPEVGVKSREVGGSLTSGVTSEASVSLEATRALVMFRSGMNVSDIAVAMNLTGTKSGAAAQRGNAQVQAWLREAMEAGQ